MQSRARAEVNRNIHNEQPKAMRASTGVHAAENSRRRRLAGSFLCGFLGAALPVTILLRLRRRRCRSTTRLSPATARNILR